MLAIENTPFLTARDARTSQILRIRLSNAFLNTSTVRAYHDSEHIQSILPRKIRYLKKYSQEEWCDGECVKCFPNVHTNGFRTSVGPSFSGTATPRFQTTAINDLTGKGKKGHGMDRLSSPIPPPTLEPLTYHLLHFSSSSPISIVTRRSALVPLLPLPSHGPAIVLTPLLVYEICLDPSQLTQSYLCHP